LTFLGFNTNGADGVFGPRTRDMIAAWQKARGEVETGFLSGAQLQALLKEAAPAIRKFEIDQSNLDQQRRAAGARKKAADDAKKAAGEEGEQNPAAASKGETEGTRGAQGITCQDDHGTRVFMADRTSCPSGLTPAP
jgi:peptidoglycan hydrolase-like protein with peptidoglycan-binding domain